MGQALAPVAEPLGIEVKCGNEGEAGIITECVGATIPMTDTGFELLLDQMVDAFTGVFNLAAVEIASQLSLNQ